MGRQKVDIYHSGRRWQPYFVSSLKVVIYNGTLRHDNHENAEGEMNEYITCGNWSVRASDRNVTGTSYTKDQLHCVKYLSLGKKVDSKYLYATQIAKSVMFT